MKSRIANVIDLEYDDGFIIEIGLTTVNLEKMEIQKSISMPIFHHKPLSPEIVSLTGWTDKKLEKQGEFLSEALERIRSKYGGRGRLLVVDSDDEVETIKKNMWMRMSSMLVDYSPQESEYWPFGGDVLNISTLFKIRFKHFENNLSLEGMLRTFDMEFIGTQHRAKDDSFNIARLFIKLMEQPTARNI